MNKLKNIDAILFDMMGVLLFQKSGYQPDMLVDQTDALIGHVTNDNNFKRETLKKFHLNEQEFNKVIVKIVDKYEPFEPIWRLLPELKKYYKLAIINNGIALTLPRFDQKLNFKKYFDLFLSSAREGIEKPDSEIYLTAVKQLGVAPEKCLFMDDSPENIDGAKCLGMQTIFWSNKERGFKEFSELIGS